jgi:hypothetical protein
MMKDPIQSRIYPSARRPPIWKEQLRFWRFLVSAIGQPHRSRSLRSALLLLSPDFVRATAWSHYVEPRPGYRPVALSPEGSRCLHQLREDGLVAIDRDFSRVADYIRDHYCAVEHELPATSPRRASGLQVSHAVSFSDRRLHEILFDPEICAIICNYYGRQAFYRDNPTVHKERTDPGSKPLISGVFHSDSYRQISFMLLLCDLTEHDTHMEYAKGSHVHRQPSYDRTRIDQDAVLREFEIAHVIGSKGKLFVFDTEGLHRGAYHRNGRREIFHVNITTGTWPFTDEKYDSLASIFSDPRAVLPYVRDFVSGAIR